MITLVLAAALLVPQVSADPCPVRVTRFEIEGRDDFRSSSARIYLENKGAVAVQSVEYQFEPYDSETRQYLGRYFLDAGGKLPAGSGKPIAPGKAGKFSGFVSSNIAILYGYWISDGHDIQINVVYFTDGSKWERKNPN